jgi:hypothetical protein
MIHSRKSPRRKFIMLLQAACGTISDRRISVLAPVALTVALESKAQCANDPEVDQRFPKYSCLAAAPGPPLWPAGKTFVA